MKIYKTMSQQICKIYITDNPRKFAPTNLYDSTVCTGIQYPSLSDDVDQYLSYLLFICNSGIFRIRH